MADHQRGRGRAPATPRRRATGLGTARRRVARSRRGAAPVPLRGRARDAGALPCGRRVSRFEGAHHGARRRVRRGRRRRVRRDRLPRAEWPVDRRRDARRHGRYRDRGDCCRPLLGGAGRRRRHQPADYHGAAPEGHPAGRAAGTTRRPNDH